MIELSKGETFAWGELPVAILGGDLPAWVLQKLGERWDYSADGVTRGFSFGCWAEAWLLDPLFAAFAQLFVVAALECFFHLGKLLFATLFKLFKQCCVGFLFFFVNGWRMRNMVLRFGTSMKFANISVVLGEI